MQDYHLKPAIEHYLNQVFKIEKNVQVAAWKWEYFYEELNQSQSYFMVLVDNKKEDVVLGYVVCRFFEKECYILNLAIDSPFQSLGLGRLMLEKVIAFFRYKGFSQIVLEVRKSNFRALNLYSRLNFSILHIREKFYSDGEDAYSMRLS